jgi:PAS domain S-box-containing protein
VASAARKEADQRFDLLLEQVVGYGIFLLDPNGFVETWNAGAERIKGYTSDEIIGRHYHTFFSEEDRRAGRPEQILRRAVAENRYQEEGWRVRKDGTRFWASIALTALRDASGQLIGFAKITRDLTEHRESEERARQLVRVQTLHEQAERDAKMRERLVRRQMQLTNLRSQVSHFAARASSLESLSDCCAHALVEHLEAALAQVWLRNDQGALRVVASRGLPDPIISAVGRTDTEALLSDVMRVGEPRIWSTLEALPAFTWAAEAGLTSVAVHPMPASTGEQSAGVLAFFARTPVEPDVLDALALPAELLVHWMERKSAQDEVQRSRDQLDLILRSISEGVSVQAHDRSWVFVNDAAARLCGCASAAEMLSLSRTELIDRFEIRREDGTPLPLEELPGRLALRGKASSAVLRFRTKPSGEERWSHVSAAPVADDSGNVKLAVSIFREFTERRRSEQAWRFLVEASATLGSSLDFQATLRQLAKLAVPEIADWASVDLLDQDGSLQQLAVAHVDPAKSELAREWRRRWPPDRRSLSYQVVESGQPQILAEITDAMIEEGSRDPEQRRVIRELGLRSAMVIPLAVGRKTFGVLTFIAAESGRRYQQQDMVMATEIGRRASLAVENARAYEEVRAAVRTRDTFLSIASHELRTPLTAMSILMTSMIRAANQGRLMSLGPEGLRDRLVKAERQTAQLSLLVDRLLDVSRLSGAEMAIERAELDLGELAGEVVSRFEDVASRAGCRIDLATEGPNTGRWDRSRIDQVLTNLISNGIKYGAGTPVHVRVASTEQETRLLVADEGPGMEEVDRERVFGQFERAASINVPGMGLGLWIVRRIVEAHGGSVALETAPGKGAAFTVRLPRRQMQEES